MSRILLINPNNKHCSDIKFLLYLNGYHVEICETINEGINRFAVFAGLDRSFDLVLIIAESNQLAELEKLEDGGFFARAIVVHENRNEGIGKNKPHKNISICTPELVLDCIHYHLQKRTTAGNLLDAVNKVLG